ncbi:unnamed protein product [Allacma fusca]|uniref:glutathione transferase n=1 Tax=Allacma fusca TaxID=39272 RepID=A0A8J2LSM9_9HEXA|nr:unnamed protein product [Allacma fusca]
MTTEYTLTYFDARGSGETIRLILAYVGAKWKEVRIPFDENTGAIIPEDIKTKMLFDQAPLLEFEGRRLVQSLAISRFLARRYNLAGKDEYESAECDQIVDACRDIYVMFVAFFREKDETKRKEGMETTTKTCKDRYFSKFNEILQKNGDFLVNNNFTTGPPSG